MTSMARQRGSATCGAPLCCVVLVDRMWCVNWLIVVEGVAGAAAVVSAVVAVVEAGSARAERERAEEAAKTAERHMRAAESSAMTMEQMAGSLKRLAESGAPAPLKIKGLNLVNVTGAPITVQEIVNRGEYAGAHLPLEVPVTIQKDESIALDVKRRDHEATLPGTLSLKISGMETPVTLPLPRPPVAPKRLR